MSPKFRQTIYYIGTLISGVIGIALLWGGISSGSADSIQQIVAGVVSLLGAGAPAIAAKKVDTQRKDGTFDPVPPADQVINGVNAVIAARDAAQAEADRVKDAVADVVNEIPVLGPLASQAIKNIAI
jgi:hypothetical protein